MLYIKRLIGTEIIIPSILSKIPPCPGSIDPVFLIFASLFKYEKKIISGEAIVLVNSKKDFKNNESF